MKKQGTINVRVYASVDYNGHLSDKDKIHYHVLSIDKEDREINDLDKQQELSPKLVGIDGISGGGDPFIVWADKGEDSIEELVNAIKIGAEKHDFDSFFFIFDYPENFFISFSDSINEEGYTYSHYRRLTRKEREQFVKAFLAACKKK